MTPDDLATIEARCAKLLADAREDAATGTLRRETVAGILLVAGADVPALVIEMWRLRKVAQMARGREVGCSCGANWDVWTGEEAAMIEAALEGA